MKIYVTDGSGNLIPIDGTSVVLELENGKTVELAEIPRPEGFPPALTLWGGRQPQPTWTEADRHRTEQLNLSLVAGNCVDIWPGRVKDLAMASEKKA